MALPTPTMLEIYRLRKVWEAEHGRPATRFYLHPSWNQPRILPPDGFLKCRGGLEWWADSRLAKDAVRFEGVMDESVTSAPNEGVQASPEPTPEPEPEPVPGPAPVVESPGEAPVEIPGDAPSDEPSDAANAEGRDIVQAMDKPKSKRVKGRAKAKKAKRMK